MITTVCKLSYSSRTVPPIVQAVQGDTGRTVRFDVTDFTIPAGAEATYFIEKPSGEAVYNAATISGNSILCELTAQSLAEPGENKMQVRVILNDEIVTSFKVCLLVSTFWGIDAIESSTEMNIFDKAVEQATEDFQTNAEQIVEEVIESIPADYTALTEEVDELNERLSSLLPQMIKNGNFADDTANWNKNFASISASDGELTLTVSNASNCQFYQNEITYKKGHVYMLIATVKASASGAIAFYGSDNIFQKINLTTSYQTFKIRCTTFTNSRTDAFFWINHSNIGNTYAVGATITFKNIMLFDLSEIFGVGKEPGTEEFYGMLTEAYYPYYDADYFVQDIVNYSGDKSGMEMINLFNKDCITKGVYVDISSGNIANYNDSYFVSDFIDVSDMDTICYTGTWRVVAYTSSYAYSQSLIGDSGDKVVSVSRPSGVSYIRLSAAISNLDKIQISKSMIDIDHIVPYGKYILNDLVEDDPAIPINLFNKNDSGIQTGHYINTDGQVAEASSYSCSDFINILGYDILTYTGTFRLTFYKADKTKDFNPTVQNTKQRQATVTVPSTSKYVRLSWETVDLDTVQIGEFVDKNKIQPFGKCFTYKGFMQTYGRPVYVSKNGFGNYTSLLQALYETTDDIVITDGDFDLVQEYKDYFSDEFFDNDFDRSVAGNFKLGLYIAQRRIKCEAGVRISFDLTGIDCSNTGGNDRRFSAINTGPNCIIEGMYLTAVNNWYVVHDDGYYNVGQCENRFINCTFIGSSLVNRNVIGAGTGTWSRTIIDGCYLDNGYVGSPSDVGAQTIRYHNTGNAGAQAAKPEIIIKNTFVNGFIGFYYYGSQTSKGLCIVNNCSMGSAIIMADASSGHAENFELKEWANVIR